LYTPQPDKFEGYSQFANPRTQPYFNQTRELNWNPKKRSEIKKVEMTFEVANPRNKSLFDYRGLKRSNLGVSFLTSTINSSHFLMNNIDLDLSARGAKPRSNSSVKASDRHFSTSTERAINGRHLSQPNTTFLELQSRRKKRSSTMQTNLVQIDDPSQWKNINVSRYLDKTNSNTAKTSHFSSTSNNTKELFKKVEETVLMELAATNPEKMSYLQTNTFRGTNLNFSKLGRRKALGVKKEKDLLEELNQTLKEEEVTRLYTDKIEVHNTRMDTRNRFKMAIPNEGDLFIKQKVVLAKRKFCSPLHVFISLKSIQICTMKVR
jgi:hypothetical protein